MRMMQLPLFLLSLAWAAIAVREEILNARAPAHGPISAAWYTGWHSTDFPLSRVSWSKYTHLAYAFATTTPDVDLLALDVSDERLLPQFVTLAHQHHVTASLSVGGWTGSRYFSTAVGSARNRTAFVNTILNIAQRYNLDGIDFDWEYPGMQGLGCNIVSPNDTSNFLSFLQELRATRAGKDLVLSAAVYVTPFADTSGQPSADVSGFAEVLDHIAVMNYDLKINPSIGAGPRSPLNDTCAPAGAKWGSAISAIDDWHKAGIPLERLVLGVPAYGHSYNVLPTLALFPSNSSQLLGYPTYDIANRKVGDRWDGEGGTDACGVTYGPTGVYTYWGLIETGFLNEDGSTRDGLVFHYDECSETPFVYNPNTEVYVSYENPRSFAAKGDFIHSSGIAGFAMWEAGGDHNDTLLDSIISSSLNGNPSARTDKSKTNGAQAVSSGVKNSTSGSPTRWPTGSSSLLVPVIFGLSFAFRGSLSPV